MKINWKVRFKSAKFWVALFALVGLVVTDLGLMGAEKYNEYVQGILVLLVAGGIITDPTVAKLGDSQQALSYEKPKKEKKDIKQF